MLPRRKCGTVQPGRVIQVIAISYAVEVGRGPQAFGGGRRLVRGVVAGVFFVGTGVMGGAVEAKGHCFELVIYV